MVPDPLLVVAELARGCADSYVVYERHGQWAFAAGATAELRLDREQITLEQESGRITVPTGEHPLDQVQGLLADLTPPWHRAYGWAAFELAHLLHGSARAAGAGTLLHLVIPAYEVLLGPDGPAQVRGGSDPDRARLAAALARSDDHWPQPATGLDFSAVGADAYGTMVTGAVEQIRAERLAKVILSRVVPVPMAVDLPATYVAGRRGNTPARSFLLNLGGVRATGFSPETVVEVGADGSVSTQPLAGTRELIGEPEIDRARRRELLADPKEIFEHAISVRLAQDELRGICRPSSLRIDEFLDVKERGSVQHLGSRVSGKLAEGVGAWQALAALFPAITASGIPKAEALELIESFEDQPRGLYSGAVLTVDSDGGMDAALVLRTVFSAGGRTWLRAGAGIVAPSTAERELQETNEKLLSIAKFLVPVTPTPAVAVAVAATATPAVAAVPGVDLTEAGVRAAAAWLTEEDPDAVDVHANLFELGLESVSLMRLVGTWREAGAEVNFAELAECPTIDGWSKLLASRQPTVSAADDGSDDTPDDTFPLAVLQHAYWVGRAAGQRLGGVAAHLYTEFDGHDVVPDQLRAAIERLVDRHAMIRVVITDNGRQRIAPVTGWRGLTVADLRDLPEAEREARLAQLRDRWSHQMLDIESGEVLATALTLLPGGRTRLHLDVDMVAADAVSYRILLADLAAYYADPDSERAALGYDYRQYRAARPRLRGRAVEQAASWWRDRLPSLPGAPDLPRAEAASVTGPPRVSRRAVMLTAAERAGLTALARAHGVTPAMAVATAFAEVVGAWSAQPRFLLNVPLFDREPVHPDVAGLVGDFTSSVLLEIDLTAAEPFVERARRVQDRMHADAAHAAYTGVEVLRDLTRLRGEQVLAPVVFTSALSLGELFDPGVRASFGEPAWIISQGPQVLLDAQVTELDGGLLVNWDSRDSEFADGVVDSMFDAFAGLVRSLAADPAVWRDTVGDLLPVGQRERRALVNATDRPRTRALLHDGFFDHARRAPRAPALLTSASATSGSATSGSASAVLGSASTAPGAGAPGTISYGELADRALRVAAALVDREVRPGDPVAVRLPKGPDQVVAVLGVLAAGGAYVPIGIEQPPARVARITALAGHRIVLTGPPTDDARSPALLPTDDAGPSALLLAEAEAVDPLPAPVPVEAEQTAYILFTSGSTGEPKGVEVPHRAAMATIEDLIGRFALGPQDRTLALSALDFDLSVFDLFAPLSVGGAVVTVAEDRRDADGWGRLLAERGVTVLNCVPALLDMLLDAAVPLGGSLRLVLLGGDRVGVDLPARLANTVPGCRFVALGGTTETAIHSTVCEVRGPVPADWRAVPYGTPLSNVRCRVVDEIGRDRPDWVAGELWIGGDGVAHGYRGDPERTADRFVLRDAVRWYRTGDLARFRGDATIEFLGRRDHQVKIRGFRIELGEVEAALAADAAVRAAVAVVVDNGRSAVLAAGLVLDGARNVPAGEPAEADGITEADGIGGVLKRVRALLPAHMIPARAVVLAEVPLTANGKVDRAAVRAAVAAAVGAGSAVGARPAPVGALESVIDLVWREVLGVDRLGTDEEFFAVGGDSVLATAVVAELRDRLDTAAVCVRALFAAPTVAGLAAELVRTQEQPGRLEAVADVVWEIESMSDEDVLIGLAGEPGLAGPGAVDRTESGA
ncbi:salicylate synthase [Frankia gtarii]|uniref:salicylate synthase n=1 Tax=Frankia gtarii TaxID=2950102 RepID=UPI002228651C